MENTNETIHIQHTDEDEKSYNKVWIENDICEVCNRDGDSDSGCYLDFLTDQGVPEGEDETNTLLEHYAVYPEKMVYWLGALWVSIPSNQLEPLIDVMIREHKLNDLTKYVINHSNVSVNNIILLIKYGLVNINQLIDFDFDFDLETVKYLCQNENGILTDHTVIELMLQLIRHEKIESAIHIVKSYPIDQGMLKSILQETQIYELLQVFIGMGLNLNII